MTFTDWLKSGSGITTVEDDGTYKYYKGDPGEENSRIRGGDDESDLAGVQRYYDSIFKPDSYGKLAFGSSGNKYVDDPLHGFVSGGNNWDSVDVNGTPMLRMGYDVYNEYKDDPTIGPLLKRIGLSGPSYNDQYGYVTDPRVFKAIQPELMKRHAGGAFDWLPAAFAAAVTAGVPIVGAGAGIGAGATLGGLSSSQIGALARAVVQGASGNLTGALTQAAGSLLPNVMGGASGALGESSKVAGWLDELPDTSTVSGGAFDYGSLYPGNGGYDFGGALGSAPDISTASNVVEGGNMFDDFDWGSFLSNPDGVDWSQIDNMMSGTNDLGFSWDNLGGDASMAGLDPELAQWAQSGGYLDGNGGIDWDKVTEAAGGGTDGSSFIPGLIDSSGNIDWSKLGTSGAGLLTKLLGQGGSDTVKKLLGTGPIGGALGGLLGLGGGSGALGIPELALLMAGLSENPDRTTTLQTTYPDWFTDASKKALGQADKYAGLGQEAIAPLSENEKAASALAKSSVGQAAPYLQKAQGAFDSASPYFSQGADLTRQASGGIPSVDLSAYMNPYTQSVLDPILRRGQIDKATTLNNLDSAAASHNAFGRNRTALLKGTASEAADRALNETEANVRSGAFNTALNTAGLDLNRKLSAGSQLGAFGNSMTNLGAGYGALGTTASNLTGQDISRLTTTGQNEREVEQAKRSTPLTALTAYTKAMPTQVNKTQTVTGPAGSKFGQLAGALAALSGLS